METIDVSKSDDEDMPESAVAAECSMAGKKRTGDEAGLDEPAATMAEHGNAGDEPVGPSGGNRLVPAKCAPPERVVATARTISLAVTLPNDNGSPLTGLECSYIVDDSKKATTDTFKVEDPPAAKQIITLGIQTYLGLSSRVTCVKVKATNAHGPSRQFSPPAYVEEKEQLCCSPLDASEEELKAALPEAERTGARPEMLARFLHKKQKQQLERLASDLQVEAPQNKNKTDLINCIVQSSLGGNADAALSAAVASKQQACAAARDELANKQQAVDSKEAAVASQNASAQRAQAAAEEAVRARDAAQKAAEKAERAAENEQRKVSAAESAADRAREQRDKEETRAAKADAELANVKLIQRALMQVEAERAKLPPLPPLPPLVNQATAGTSSSSLGSVPAGSRSLYARPMPAGLTVLKLRNRVKKWAESDAITKAALQRCYKALGNQGDRDKETLVRELIGSHEQLVKFLRLPEALSDKAGDTGVPEKKLALIYTSTKDMPSADGMSRAAMVEELVSWLMEKAHTPLPSGLERGASRPPIAELYKSVVALGAGFDVPSGAPLLPKTQVGTGFYITKEGLLSTCHHVLMELKNDSRLAVPAGATRIFCVGVGSPIQWTYRASLVHVSSRPGLPPQPQSGGGSDPMLDLAIFRVDRHLDGSAIDSGASTAAFRPSPFADSDAAEEGSRLWILGYGQQLSDVTDTTNTVSGDLSGRHTDQDGNWLRTSADMLGGHSGGPGVGRDGRVVGWCVKSHTDNRVACGGLHALRPINDAVAELKSKGFLPSSG